MKKYKFLWIMIALLTLLQPLITTANAQDLDFADASVRNGCNTIDGQSPVYGTGKLLEAATSAMLYEVNSGTLLYSWNADQQVYPAGLVKIMTALIVLENADITEVVTVSNTAVASISELYATLKLIPGEQFTVDQMLYAILVGSANDAAAVLAEHIAGSEEAFVQMMNKRALELGCTGTYFTNVHGLHSDEQFTTARDMVKITAEAMKHPYFMEYFSTMSYRIAATEFSPIRRVEATNLMMSYTSELYYDARVTGGRTGITSDKSRSIVITAESKGFNFIIVVLAAQPSYKPGTSVITRFGSYEEAKELLKLGFEQNKLFQVLYEGQSLASYNVNGGDSLVSLGPTDTISVVLPKDVTFEDMDVRFGVSNGSFSAPIEKGTELTDVQIWLGDVCVAQSPVVSLNKVAYAGSAKMVPNSKSSIDFMNVVRLIALVILVIAAIMLIIYFILRSVGLWRRVKLMILHRRRRTGRRRSR